MLRPAFVISSMIFAIAFLCTSTHAQKKKEAGKGSETSVSEAAELKRIQDDIKRRQATIDSLRAQEKRTQRQVEEIEGKLSADKKVVGKLDRELGALKGSIRTLERELAEGNRQYDEAVGRYQNVALRTYYSARTRGGELLEPSLTELDLYRTQLYLSALIGHESAVLAQTDTLLERVEKQLAGTTGRSVEVLTLKKKKESAVALQGAKKAAQEKALKKIRRQHSLTADELITLQQAASAMEDIIARLETERAKKGNASTPNRVITASIEGDKGALRAPCPGEIAVTYGARTDPVTNLKSFSPGITIATDPGMAVTAVSEGVVQYSGALRGYGSFVILLHGEDFYTTYAGLSTVLVSAGRVVPRGSAVGAAGADGIVRFELRKNRETLDPLEWIRHDSFSR